MNDFEQYLAFYEIDAVRLSIQAKVRYSTVYNAKKGHPITTTNAQKITDAVFRLTGVAYTGSLVLLEQQLDQFPTTPVQNIQQPPYY